MEFYQQSCFIIVIIYFFTIQSSALDCYTAKGEYGSCIEIRSCPAMVEILKMYPLQSETVKYLKESRCRVAGSSTSEVIICCPSHSSLSFTTSNPSWNASDHNLLPTNCGQETMGRIVGGEVTDIDEFPWMALLEYQTPNGIKTLCSGVVINKRYVLSAAHCIKGKGLPKNYRAVNVRLGEYDTTSNPDCIIQSGYQVCADPIVIIPIQEIITHEDYVPNSKGQPNDIALLRLSKDIVFTNYIQPICLPQNSNVESLLYTAGWGRTEYGTNSDKKLKLSVPAVSIERCIPWYRSAGANLGHGQICAGGDKGRDSCRGDSGGPLMAKSRGTVDNKPKWVSVGIVSFGPSPCGREGWPGVYTKVHDFMPWILRNMRPAKK
ncbi:serine protease easter-like [Leptopilina heterotoma]|uniref:serine protease easter-like n=1 Tax=Leptopilina heterotoma TaxID=63436 RepID=UPI001CA80D2B|nr:serine protease easter-like [Leptopilina heterotoma]